MIKEEHLDLGCIDDSVNNDILEEIEDFDKKVDKGLTSFLNEEDLYDKKNWQRAHLKYFPTQNMTDWTNKSMLFNEKHPTTVDPIEMFELAFTEEFWLMLVDQTNLYANQFISTSSNYLEKFKYSKVHRWKPTNIIEMKTYLGIILYSTVLRLADISDYWLESPLIDLKLSRFIKSNRFSLLSKFLHVNNNISNSKTDRLYKIRPLLNYCRKIFKSFSIPGIFLTIDEDIIPFKGRIIFKQFIKNKPTRYGIKINKICCARSSYCYDFKIYSGIDNDNNPKLSKLEDVVMSLSWEYLNSGRHIFADNFFTTPNLVLKLAKMKTAFTGTLRINRLKNKDILIKEKELKSQGPSVIDNGDVRLLQFYDRKCVYILTSSHRFKENDFIYNSENSNSYTTIHDNNFSEKSQIIVNYNYYSQGVDKCNQMLKYYKFGHKSSKWWKPVFYYMINSLIHNLYVIYNFKKGKLTNKEFRIKIIEHLLFQPGVRKKPSLGANISNKPEVHLPVPIDADKRSKIRKRCKVCNANTTWKCLHCSESEYKPIVICINKCFLDYHKNKYT